MSPRPAGTFWKPICPACPEDQELSYLDGATEKDGGAIRVYECPCCHALFRANWDGPKMERTDKRYVAERG